MTQTQQTQIDAQMDRAYDLILSGSENVATTIASEFDLSAIEAETVVTKTRQHPIMRAALAYNSR